MSTLTKEIVFLLLQYLDGERYKETVHLLEMESGVYFNMRYFEELVTNGDWSEAEKYVSAFTNLKDNDNSVKIFFGIRKQNYLEALDKHETEKALDILLDDLKVFEEYNKEIYKKLTHLLPSDNFRVNVPNYTDIQSRRRDVFIELEKLIMSNPSLQDKVKFPTDLKNPRLRQLLDQSLSWQHLQCTNPSPFHVNRSLFNDHICNQQKDAQAPPP